MVINNNQIKKHCTKKTFDLIFLMKNPKKICHKEKGASDFIPPHYQKTPISLSPPKKSQNC